MPERGFTTETWDEMWFRKLSKDQRYLYWYLSTNSHCNQAAVYPLALDQIAFEAKIPEADLPVLLESLAPYVMWYKNHDYIWVRDFIKRQLKSPLFLVAVAKALSSVNVNGLVKEVVDYNLQQYTISIPYQYHPNTVPILARALVCSDSVSDSVSSSVSDKTLFSDDLFSLIQQCVSKVPTGVDKLAQHEALKQALADLCVREGYQARSEFPVTGGRIDLCWLTPGGEVVAAFEIDYRTPRQGSLEKLRNLQCANKYVLVRKGGLRFLPIEQVEQEYRPLARQKQCAKVWLKVLADLQARVSKPNYTTWFAQTVALGEAEGQFFIGVPSNHCLEYIEQNQRSTVEAAFTRVTGKPARLVFEVIS
ncbi:MAG: DnaA N-terminal domain-containing protein [Chloroflexota bacterium]